MLLQDHPDELEADFQEHYHLNLMDIWTGDLSVLRTARLASQLPRGARSWMVLGDDRGWTYGDHIAATISDILAWANYQRGEGKGQEPKPYPRPGDIKEATDKAIRKEAEVREAYRRLKERTSK